MPPLSRLATLDAARASGHKNNLSVELVPDASAGLLIYILENDILVLTLTRTGSHAEIFNK